jgi:hypothetical protein
MFELEIGIPFWTECSDAMMASLHSSLGIRGTIIISSFRVDLDDGMMSNLSGTEYNCNVERGGDVSEIHVRPSSNV